MSLTATQMQDILITERVSSIFSLVGAAFVIITFVMDEKFRKPINRLVFFATFGNILTNIATLISTNGIEAGPAASLCQFQAFLIQWFMPADALWTFAMACNVWLSFFRSYDSATFRRLEHKYIIACYGVPLIPALIYLFIKTEGRDSIYGSAVLWCWVTVKWDFLRVATFYGPVWIVILCTIGIYVRVGKIILNWRRSVLDMEKAHGLSAHFPSTGIIKTSEVTITRTEGSKIAARPFSHVTKKASFPPASAKGSRTTISRVYRPTGATNPNKAALKYCKCSLLFFVALIITWVPSTVNRIYNIVRPSDVVFGLNLAAALVLPLQGFWNAVIYIATSTFAVKCLWEDVKEACRLKRRKHNSVGMSMHASPVPITISNETSERIGARHVLRQSSSPNDFVEPAR